MLGKEEDTESSTFNMLEVAYNWKDISKSVSEIKKLSKVKMSHTTLLDVR